MKNLQTCIEVMGKCRVLALVAVFSMMTAVLTPTNRAVALEVSETEELVAFGDAFGDRILLYDNFGQSVAIDGDILVVGAPGPVYGSETTIIGMVYVMEWNGSSWIEQANLTASDGSENDDFGRSVSIDGNTLVIGARTGAYVFHWDGSTWTQEQKLTAGDGAAGDVFGGSVSISGDTVVVGARGDDDNGESSGSAYVFYQDQGGADNWGQVQKLTASDGSAGDWLGYPVSISGDTLVVGARNDDDNGSNSGSAYLFERNQGGADNWGEVQKITASDGAAGDVFGKASIDGDTIVVGASGAPAVYIFQWGGSTWIETQTIPGFFRFGESVAINGDTLVVGDSYENSGHGVAHVFGWNGASWVRQQYLLASDGAEHDFFGRSVAISGDNIVIGAPQSYVESGPFWFWGCGVAYLFHRDGASWTEEEEFFPIYLAMDAVFGISAAIDGDTLVVGGDDGSGTGIAWVFRWDGTSWIGQKKLVASDAADGDYFGDSVSISGDTIVVGAVYSNDDNGVESGSAYVFYRNEGGTDNWGQIKRITPSDSAAGKFFGVSVSISGDTLVAGAVFDDDNGTEAGAAYFFYRNQGGVDNWGEVQKITASDGSAGDWLGYPVSISGDTVAIGAMKSDDNGSNSGSAYLFERNQGGADNWGEVQKITASDGAADDQFGSAVSISYDTVVVGSEETDGSESGSVYIFDRDYPTADDWGERQKVTASGGGGVGDLFGWWVSIRGDTLVVGAPNDDDNGDYSGSAYIFERDQGGADNWGEVQKITASDGAAGDVFGYAVAISGNRIVIGAFGKDKVNLQNAGSAYVFVPEPSRWLMLGAGLGCLGVLYRVRGRR